MKSGTIFLLLGLLALWAELPPAAGERPGACPKPTGMGICAELCSRDESCPPGEKCCSNGCGHVCMQPITTGTPGFCPRPTGLGGCAVRCRSDVQCFRGHKCCRTRCGGYVCTRAIGGPRFPPLPQA